MTSIAGRVRQLAPHWAAMFLLMITALWLVERLVGSVGPVLSLALVVAVGIGYPSVVRALGVAPPVWQRS